MVYNTHLQRPRTVCIENAFAERDKKLELCPHTSWKILQKDLGLRSYKIQLVQELKPNKIKNDPNIHKKKIISVLKVTFG